MSEPEKPKQQRVEPEVSDRETRSRLRRFRIVIAVLSFAFSVLLVAALIRFGVVPPGPFSRLVPGGGETVDYPVERGALVLEEPGAEKTGHRYLYDETLGWRNIPNWKSTTFGRKLTINSLGLRGPERPYEKSPGVKRMLVLGDSYAWGYGVADDEIFTRQLEALLAGRTSKWEVINASVSGWSTDQQYLFLRDEGLKYSPDIVLLAFCSANDVIGATRSRIYGLNKPLIGKGFADFAGRPGELSFVNQPVPKPGDKDGHLEIPNEVQGQVLEALVGGIFGLTTQYGAELTVASFGRFQNPANGSIKRAAREMKSAVRALRIPHFIDVDLALWDRSLALSDLVDESIEHDGHWDAAAHRMVAEILEESLRQDGVLDRIESGSPQANASAR